MTQANLLNRGRTRNQATVRAQRRLERVVTAGGRRLEILLDAEAAKALERQIAATGETARAVVLRLLAQADQLSGPQMATQVVAEIIDHNGVPLMVDPFQPMKESST